MNKSWLVELIKKISGENDAFVQLMKVRKPEDALPVIDKLLDNFYKLRSLIESKAQQQEQVVLNLLRSVENSNGITKKLRMQRLKTEGKKLLSLLKWNERNEHNIQKLELLKEAIIKTKELEIIPQEFIEDLNADLEDIYAEAKETEKRFKDTEDLLKKEVYNDKEANTVMSVLGDLLGGGDKQELLDSNKSKKQSNREEDNNNKDLENLIT